MNKVTKVFKVWKSPATGRTVTPHKYDYAQIEIEEGWIFKKRKTIDVWKEHYSVCWRLEDGQFTPGYMVENAISAHLAQLEK